MSVTKGLEIIIYGRGGQGAKTAAQLIAEVAIGKGEYAQAFPEYGPERTGAPVKSFARISDEPIKTSQPITKPDVVMVIDPTLLESIDVNSGMGKEGILIVNSPKKPEEIKKQTGFEGEIYTVDATGIAIKYLGRNLPNMPILGAFVKITKAIDIESLLEKVKAKFLNKIGKEKTEANLSAIREAYESVKV